MSDVTVKQLANVLGMPAEKLLTQLAEAGMKFSDAEQVVSSTEKVKLLGFLRRTHGKTEKETESGSPRQITLKRKTVSEITVAGTGIRGVAKTVNVEVRQKRTYVKRSSMPEEQEIDLGREDALRKLQESPLKRETEESLRQEHERRRQAEEIKLRQFEEARVRAEEEQRQKVSEEANLSDSSPAIVSPPLLAANKETSISPAQLAKPRGKEKSGLRNDSPPARREPPRREGTEEPRHKAGRGSHRMRGDDVDVTSAARYFGAELHLSEAGSSARRSRKKPRQKVTETVKVVEKNHAFSKPTAPVVKEVAIGESIVIADLAQKMAVKGAEVVKALFKMGVMATINEVIDHDTAVLVVEELGHKAVIATAQDAESTLIARTEEDRGNKENRPPVVTVMGHVDHGKTSLLDYIRRTKVASGEAGGITQHIGAYHVETDKGVISFLDTPGHAAFTAMRARGAKLTDIVVLVVAADDGVMPQTIEAVQHAKAANVPLIVAVNKMDKPGADPDNVKQGLIQYEVVPEEWGGENIFVPVSAKAGTGIDALLDAILVQAEMMELKAVKTGLATGVVIESSLDKGRGPIATVLVQQGTLKRGDFLVCGVEYGRVRAMFDEAGRTVEMATPSIPVQLLGLSGVPEAGDDFVVVADERLARDVAQQRQQKRRETRLIKQHSNKLEDLMSQMTQGEEQRTLNVVIKADVQGSTEALRDSLAKLTNERVRVNVIGSGVGGITESDATLAAASKAIVIGFNVRADASARKVINESSVDVRYFSIIYDVIDQIRQAVTGLLGTEIREDILGIAQVRDVFRSSKFGAIAGCMVLEGIVKRNRPIRVLRDNVVVFEGELESLRRFKDNVEEVRNGMECGIGVKQYNDVKPGDQIECFERIEVQRTL